MANFFQTPTNTPGFAPWAYTEPSAATPENARAFDQTDASLWPTEQGLDGLEPGFMGDSLANNALQHHSHHDLGIDTSSEPQRYALPTQRGASSAHPPIPDHTHSPSPDTVVKDVINAQASRTPTQGLSYNPPHPLSHIGSSSQYHTPQTEGNTPYSSIPDIASPIRGIEVSESVVQAQTSRPSKGGSSGVVARDYSSLDAWLSSQPQYTHRRQQNVSSQYHPDLTHAPTLDQEVSHNPIETQQQGVPTRSKFPPDFRYHAVSSSSQLPRHEPQNQQHVSSSYPRTPDSASNNPVPNPDVSGDVDDAQAQVSGSSAAYLRNTSYLGVDPYSQPQQRSRKKGKQPRLIPVAPPKRRLLPANPNVLATGPYPNPASRFSARPEWTPNVASSSTGPRRSNDGEVNSSPSSLPTADPVVGYPTTSFPLNHSLVPQRQTLNTNPPQVRPRSESSHYRPRAPSQRKPLPAKVPPYPNPASARPEWTPNVASSSTGPRRSNRGEVNSSPSSLPTADSVVGYPTTSFTYGHSLIPQRHIVNTNPPQVQPHAEPLPYRPTAPSQRKPLPANAPPYPNPASARPEWTPNVASSSTGPRRSNDGEVNFSPSSLPTADAAVGYPYSHEPSSAPPTCIPPIGRNPVPLRTWIQGEEMRTIEFWTTDKATGNIILGTFFADKHDRSLIDPESFPMAGNDAEKFYLHILVGSAPLLSHVAE